MATLAIVAVARFVRSHEYRLASHGRMTTKGGQIRGETARGAVNSTDEFRGTTREMAKRFFGDTTSYFFEHVPPENASANAKYIFQPLPEINNLFHEFLIQFPPRIFARNHFIQHEP